MHPTSPSGAPALQAKQAAQARRRRRRRRPSACLPLPPCPAEHRPARPPAGRPHRRALWLLALAGHRVLLEHALALRAGRARGSRRQAGGRLGPAGGVPTLGDLGPSSCVQGRPLAQRSECPACCAALALLHCATTGTKRMNLLALRLPLRCGDTCGQRAGQPGGRAECRELIGASHPHPWQKQQQQQRQHQRGHKSSSSINTTIHSSLPSSLAPPAAACLQARAAGQ